MTTARPSTSRLLSALLALALVMVGFGHRPVQSAPADPALLAYLQAGGTLDALCLAEGDAPGPMAQDCPVCTLAHAMALAPAPVAPATRACPEPLRLSVPGQAPAQAHMPRAPPARGPPAFPV